MLLKLQSRGRRSTEPHRPTTLGDRHPIKAASAKLERACTVRHQQRVVRWQTLMLRLSAVLERVYDKMKLDARCWPQARLLDRYALVSGIHMTNVQQSDQPVGHVLPPKNAKTPGIRKIAATWTSS